jgi:hypothetical protein
LGGGKGMGTSLQLNTCVTAHYLCDPPPPAVYSMTCLGFKMVIAIAYADSSTQPWCREKPSPQTHAPSLVAGEGGGKRGLTASHRASSIRMPSLPPFPTHTPTRTSLIAWGLSFTFSRDLLGTSFSNSQPRVMAKVTYRDL